MSKLSKLPAVTAPSPADRNNPVRLSISQTLVNKLVGIGRAQKLFECWSLIVGKPPPINNIGYHENFERNDDLLMMADAVAVFQGVKRPHLSDFLGQNVLIYVLNPSSAYQRVADQVCMARKVEVPDSVVFVVYVMLDDTSDGDGSDVQGVIIGWEFVEADPADRQVPLDSQSRYRKRCW